MGTSANSVVADAEGVEFGLRWGYGWVKSITTPKARQNGRVEFMQDGHEFPSAGSIRLREQADLVAMLKDAESDQKIYFAFRLESHRDRTYDQTVPFADIAKMEDNNKILHSRLVAAYPDGTEEAKLLIKLCEAQERAKSVKVEPAEPDKPVDNQPTVHQLPGETWEFAASMGCTELAFDLLLAAKAGGLIERYGETQLTELAATFLRIADTAQVSVTGRLDRAGRAHTRARGAMRTALKRYPVPFVTTPNEPEEDRAARWGAWEDSVLNTTLLLLQIADKILRPVNAA